MFPIVVERVTRVKFIAVITGDNLFRSNHLTGGSRLPVGEKENHLRLHNTNAASSASYDAVLGTSVLRLHHADGSRFDFRRSRNHVRLPHVRCELKTTMLNCVASGSCRMAEMSSRLAASRGSPRMLVDVSITNTIRRAVIGMR